MKSQAIPCAETPFWTDPASPGSSESSNLLPFIQSSAEQFAETYETVVSAFVHSFWSDSPELALSHGHALNAFVRTFHPKQKFLTRHQQWAHRNPVCDPNPRAVADAIRGTSHAIDVYVRRFVETDFTAPFFEASRNFDDACLIAWIAHELNPLDYQDITGNSFEFSHEDQIYAFCSPVFSWQNGFGQQGIVVIRASRIIDCVVIEAS